jgi:DNA-binding beta-propeller fold protein YncE
LPREGHAESGLVSAAHSVINGATCNANITSGCGETPATLANSQGGFALAVGQASDTVYATSIIGSETEVFNGATCNGSQQTGCAQTPASVQMGGFPAGAALDERNGTVYVADPNDGDVYYFGCDPWSC